jgi:7,8-dihydroneopterin aldolase/epimerase/oxygenase
MTTIELQNIRLHAFHGIYDGEKKTGSPYDVSVKVVYDEGAGQFDNLEKTINYVVVFEIIKQKMQMPLPLLEQVAMAIIGEIKQRWPFAVDIVVSIYKLEPPIENFQGKMGVSIHKEFNV